MLLEVYLQIRFLEIGLLSQNKSACMVLLDIVSDFILEELYS